MNRSDQIESILADALAIESDDERRQFVERACGGDAELRREVEELIESHVRASGFFERLAVRGPEITTETAPRERPGTVIGPYKLVEQIGEGGFGTVFVAEQRQPVRRHVALKVLKPGMDTAQVVARFEAERQALALMNHSNIAQVFDGGETAAGRPYFVMELVKGIPITKYCDEQQLSPRERLALFVPVCDAVQHAHQKGIIHRDIKPSNVLVAPYDGRPVPKVIDFGVAKALGQQLTERTLVTNFGGIVGTLEYMSPEQAEFNALDVDTRADIYGLGVLLYELLTGTTPLTTERAKRAAITEVLRVIREEEPPTPSSRLSESSDSIASISAQRKLEPARLTKEVRGELDWIVMKCLDKERTRRYETANGLARDIQRFLSDEPVEAGPPSASYRMRKFARKHKKLLTTVGGFVVLLVAATAISVGLASWALKERDRAEEQNQLAEANFKRAFEAVDKMLTRVAETQLVNVPQMEPIRRDLLKDALRFYQEFLRERGENVTLRSEAAEANDRVARIHSELGERQEAEEAYRHELTLLEKLVADFPDNPAYTHRLAGAYVDLGQLYLFTQRLPHAEAALQQAITIREQLSSRYPTNLELRNHLATNYASLVSIYRQMGRLGEAESAFLKGETIGDSVLSNSPNDVTNLTALAQCYQNGALVYAAQGRNADAEAAGQKAMALNQQLIRLQPEVVEHQKRAAQTQNNLGLLYGRNGQPSKAEAAYKESLALNEAILRDHPKVVRFKVDVAGSYGNMAVHVRNHGSAEEALEWSVKAIGILEPVLEQDPRDAPARMGLFDAYLGRALTLLRMNRPEEAAKDWRRAVDVSAGQSHINMRLFRVLPLARLGEHEQAATEAENLLKEGRVPSPNLYMFVCAYSLCAAAATEDARLSPAEREKLVEKYSSRAVELLRKSQAAGQLKNADRLKTDKNLDAVRSRPDFQALLAEVDAKTRPNP